MGLYVMQGKDDASSAAAAVLAGGYAIDSLVSAVNDLGGTVHALLLTAGPYNLVGIVELPSEEAAVSLRYLQSSLGRDLELLSAVPVTAWPGVVELMSKVTLPKWTSPGDTPDEVFDVQPQEARP